MSDWFNNLGWPAIIRSDGGPQFSGPLKQWCKENNIKHEVSSPYNIKSNGLAKAAVKNVKSIIANKGGNPDVTKTKQDDSARTISQNKPNRRSSIIIIKKKRLRQNRNVVSSTKTLGPAR